MLDNTKKISANAKYTAKEIFDLIMNDKELYEKVGALFSMNFMKFEDITNIDENCIPSISGKYFSEDGGGGYYILLEDGTFGYASFDFPLESGRIANNFVELLELCLNCAYDWQNYLDKKYIGNFDLLEKEFEDYEKEGYEQFEDAYGDEMPPYLELQKEISEKLDLKIYENPAKEVLLKVFEILNKEPKFTIKCIDKHFEEISEDLLKDFE